ncbi:MAG TPA: glutathione S-transferase family protein [Polyangiaceae bacterium]|nr:glutathione S-transferase family protein [Polyangiaceae bacterium]
MRTLYHIRNSPYSRRARLALAHKGLACELKEVRETPSFADEARGLVALKTFPVLKDGEHAMADSTAIMRWLDAAYPSAPRLWPEGDDAFLALEVTSLVDAALTGIVNSGVWYYPLREHAAWGTVTGEILGRVQRSLDAVAARLGSLRRPTIAASGWSAADMCLYTAVTWFEGMPERAKVSPNIAQILAVGGWTAPAPLRIWADAHRHRPDVVALG